MKRIDDLVHFLPCSDLEYNHLFLALLNKRAFNLYRRVNSLDAEGEISCIVLSLDNRFFDSQVTGIMLPFEKKYIGYNLVTKIDNNDDVIIRFFTYELDTLYVSMRYMRAIPLSIKIPKESSKKGLLSLIEENYQKFICSENPEDCIKILLDKKPNKKIHLTI